MIWSRPMAWRNILQARTENGIVVKCLLKTINRTCKMSIVVAKRRSSDRKRTINPDWNSKIQIPHKSTPYEEQPIYSPWYKEPLQCFPPVNYKLKISHISAPFLISIKVDHLYKHQSCTMFLSNFSSIENEEANKCLASISEAGLKRIDEMESKSKLKKTWWRFIE